MTLDKIYLNLIRIYYRLGSPQVKLYLVPSIKSTMYKLPDKF